MGGFAEGVAGVATWVPAFAAREDASGFVSAVHEWFRRQVLLRCRGRAEACACEWLRKKGMEVLSLDLGLGAVSPRPASAATATASSAAAQVAQPEVPTGEAHSHVRRAAGFVGTVLSLGLWGSSRSWAVGASELQVGRELNVDFFV